MKFTTNGLLLRKVERGDSDLVLTFFTETHGTVSAIAYAARRSRRRFAVLDAFHTLRVEFDDVAGRDLAVLGAASVAVPRTSFLRDLSKMQGASTALGWVRKVCPARAPDPAVWQSLVAFLDSAEASDADALALFGIAFLRQVGLAPAPQSIRSGMSAAAVVRAVDDAVRQHAGR